MFLTHNTASGTRSTSRGRSRGFYIKRFKTFPDEPLAAVLNPNARANNMYSIDVIAICFASVHS